MFTLLLGGTYIALSSAILVSKHVTWLHAFLHYGKVKLDVSSEVLQEEKSVLQRVRLCLARLADYTVPKLWFAHFYYVYFALLAAVGFLQKPQIQTWSRYSLIWVLLMTQAVRRAYESSHVTRWSPTLRMHVTHYFAGLYFYVATPITCAMGLEAPSSALSFPTALLVLAVFLACSVDQHRHHVHLALLKKYTIPHAGLFTLTLSPHYLDEIGIYASVTAIACSGATHSPADSVLLCSMLFVAVNLCVSAIETNQYYQRRFPAETVRWALIPGIF